jgi:phosphatidylserine/phosphatidylglycerophosphate/cardiolipin synthase-like enzyme
MDFDNRSMALNDESTLMVRDRAFGAQMIQLFLDDLDHATEITAAESAAGPCAIAAVGHDSKPSSG